MGGVKMDLKQLGEQLTLLQDCYQKVASAQSDWNEYRRKAAEYGSYMDNRPEFVSLLKALTHTAEELERIREAVSNALCGDGIIQAEIYSADGKTSRKAVIERPTAKITEPHISYAAYHALVLMLGDSIYTTAPFDIAIIDDFGKISSARIIHKN